ncbi:MAG: NADH-quinone oxidoreductase subunit NuoH [Pyrodictiaceae archaeon]
MADLITVVRFILSPPILAPIVYPGLIVALITVLIVIWLERKFAALVQLRIGPYYVSRQLHGALQLVADGARFFFQEVIIPITVDRRAFVLAPILSLAFISLSFTVIPGGPGVYGFYSPYNLLIALAVTSLGPIMVLVAGWAANNKFTYIGGAREALLTMAYEPLLFAGAFAGALMYNSLDLNVMVEKQASTGIPGIVANPLAALLFLLAMMAATDRIPFDIVLGEQEIVSGPYTEYTGIMYGVVMGLDYIKLYALSLIFTDMFLAGWAPFNSMLLGSIVVYVKTFIVIAVAVFMRTVYGRLRLDHALDLLWSKLIPLAFVATLISVASSMIYP